MVEMPIFIAIFDNFYRCLPSVFVRAQNGHDGNDGLECPTFRHLGHLIFRAPFFDGLTGMADMTD